MNNQFTNELNALQQGAALQVREDAGTLVLAGEDRSDFLQRMTTNDIKRLKVGQSAVTVLTSPTARTLFVFTVLCRENELWLLPARGETTTLERHLAGNIFFMDKVSVRNISNDWRRARLMGPQSAAVLDQLLPNGTLVDDQWQEMAGMVAVRQQKYDLPGYELLLAAAQEADLRQRLLESGALLLEDAAAYTAQRIALSRPLPGAELSSEYTPLESGLTWACAENKGCYTGQEIIARQITYDKVTKCLVQVRSSQPLAVGAALEAEGKDAGVVTSVAAQLEPPLALAIVKRTFSGAGSQLTVNGINTTVVELA